MCTHDIDRLIDALVLWGATASQIVTHMEKARPPDRAERRASRRLRGRGRVALDAITNQD